MNLTHSSTTINCCGWWNQQKKSLEICLLTHQKLMENMENMNVLGSIFPSLILKSSKIPLFWLKKSYKVRRSATKVAAGRLDQDTVVGRYCKGFSFLRIAHILN